MTEQLSLSVTSGSRWKHHSGKLYTVIYLANIKSNKSIYPVSVVYIGKSGYIWVKSLENFLLTMIPEEGGDD